MSSSFERVPPSPSEGVLNVVVESPAGSTAKMRWDPKLGLFALSRPLPLGVAYPHDWGFVPGTRASDGDPVDALVLSEGTLYPGVLVAARPLGVVRLEQNRKQGGGRERNDRVVAAPVSAARLDVRRAAELPERLRAEIEQFFLSAVFFEHKDAVVLGWGDPDAAWDLVKTAAAAGRGR
jgi:inorganic pyrophosphatase